MSELHALGEFFGLITGLFAVLFIVVGTFNYYGYKRTEDEWEKHSFRFTYRMCAVALMAMVLANVGFWSFWLYKPR